MSNKTSPETFHDAERYVAGTVTVIIAGSALIGNGLVFCAFLKFRKLRRPTNYFIINLAVYDFLVGCLPITFWASYLFTNKPTRVQGEFDVIYWLWECVDILCGIGSAASLAFVAIDRYVCIKDALRYNALVTKTRFYLCLAFIWAYSLIPVVLSYLKTRKIMKGTIFRYYIFIAGFIIPVTVMAFCYINIFLVTVRLQREMQQTQRLGTFAGVDQGLENREFQNNEVELQQADSNTQKSPIQAQVPADSRSSDSPMNHSGNGVNLQGGFAVNERLGSTNDNRSASIVQLTESRDKKTTWAKSCQDSAGWGKARQQTASDKRSQTQSSSSTEQNVHKAELKAAKTLSVIMGAFLLTWTPFIIGVMLYEWNKIILSGRTSAFIKSLHYFNSGLNPFLYSILNVHFRKAFASILMCKSNARLD